MNAEEYVLSIYNLNLNQRIKDLESENAREAAMDDVKSMYQGSVSMSVGVESDPVNHPSHYTSHPSGVEVIQITEHMNFCLGNAIKYILRADHKGNQIQDLKKAVWYINREIDRLQNG